MKHWLAFDKIFWMSIWVSCIAIFSLHSFSTLLFDLLSLDSVPLFSIFIYLPAVKLYHLIPHSLIFSLSVKWWNSIRKPKHAIEPVPCVRASCPPEEPDLWLSRWECHVLLRQRGVHCLFICRQSSCLQLTHEWKERSWLPVWETDDAWTTFRLWSLKWNALLSTLMRANFFSFLRETF